MVVCLAKYPCRSSGCCILLERPGFCVAHRSSSYKLQNSVVSFDYKERNRFYQSKEWKLARAIRLDSEPMCRNCRASGILSAASVVDHIVAIEAGGSMLDQDNLQSLCESCHNSKTGRDREGRGNV